MNNINSIPTDLNKLQFQTIDWLRFTFTLLVFYIHMNPFHYEQYIKMSNITWGNGLNWEEVYSVLVTFVTVLASIAVPSFFMFSGYLFYKKFDKWDKALYFGNLKSRIRTLFIPYILWNTIAALAGIAKAIMKHESPLAYLLNIWNNGILHIYWDSVTWAEDYVNLFGWSLQGWGPASIAYWFVRDLMVMCLLSPLLFLCIRYLKIYFILILGAAYIFKIWTIFPGFSIDAFFFFSTGAFLSINKKNMIEEFSKIKYVIYTMSLIFLIATIGVKDTIYEVIIEPLFIIPGVFSAFLLAAILLQKKTIKVNIFLTKASFFLYSSHAILLLSLSREICNKALGTDHTLSIIISYLISPLLCLIICISLFLLLKKLAPAFLNLLTGNRN